MAAPNYLVRAFLRVACLQGRDVLEALVTGQFTAVQQGGMQMISSTSVGQSFAFNVDPKLSISEIMALAEEALETFDGMGGVDAVTAFLKRPPVTRAQAVFLC